MFFSLPFDAGRRLPQSVQKIKEPIAAMVSLLALLSLAQVSPEKIVARISTRTSNGFLQSSPSKI